MVADGGIDSGQSSERSPPQMEYQHPLQLVNAHSFSVWVPQMRHVIVASLTVMLLPR